VARDNEITDFLFSNTFQLRESPYPLFNLIKNIEYLAVKNKNYRPAGAKTADNLKNTYFYVKYSGVICCYKIITK